MSLARRRSPRDPCEAFDAGDVCDRDLVEPASDATDAEHAAADDAAADAALAEEGAAVDGCRDAPAANPKTLRRRVRTCSDAEGYTKAAVCRDAKA